MNKAPPPLTESNVRAFCEEGIRKVLDEAELRHMTKPKPPERNKRHEQEVTRLLRKAFPGQAVNRALNYAPHLNMPHIECPLLWAFLTAKQPNHTTAMYHHAIAACPEGRIPVLINKPNRQEAHTVTMPLKEFIMLLASHWKLNCKTFVNPNDE